MALLEPEYDLALSAILADFSEQLTGLYAETYARLYELPLELRRAIDPFALLLPPAPGEAELEG
jgi:hypothetical protein